MNEVKILHLADYHLGLEFPFLGRLSDQRKIETLNSFRKLCEDANLIDVEIMLIAGDFIEASYMTKAFIDEIKNILSTVQARVFIVAGNHDYISIGSYYLDEDWPDNVHIFKDSTFEKVTLDDLKTSIFGASFTSTYQRHSFLDQNIELDSDMINIILCHGDITTSMNGLYNTITKDQIASSGADYIALGHIHKKSGVLKVGNTFYGYPGSPCAQNFAELGHRDAIVGRLSKLGFDHEYILINSPLFIEERIDISKLETETEIANTIQEKLETKYDNYKDNYYRVILEGNISENSLIDMNLIKSHFQDIKYLDLFDNTKIKIDLDLLSKEYSLKGLFVKNIMEMREKAMLEGDLERYLSLEKSLEIGLRAFEGRQI